MAALVFDFFCKKQTNCIISENTSKNDCSEGSLNQNDEISLMLHPIQICVWRNCISTFSHTTFLTLLSLTPEGEQQISELNSPLRWINHRFVGNIWNSKYANMLQCPYVTILNICLNSAPFESTVRVWLPTILLSHKPVPRSILTQLLVPCGPSWPPVQQ